MSNDELVSGLVAALEKQINALMEEVTRLRAANNLQRIAYREASARLKRLEVELDSDEPD